MSTQTSHIPHSQTYDLVLTRVFDAPRELVFAAWTQPEHLAHWICPEGFKVDFADVDLRVGGKWRSGMHSPDGETFIHFGTYLEIKPPERLVMTHKWEKNHLEPIADTTLTIELEDLNGQTRMTFTHAGLATPESRDSHKGGWTGAFDSLGEMLKQKSFQAKQAMAALKLDLSQANTIYMEREFAADRQRVYDCFTQPEKLKKWMLGPPGWTMAVCEFDLKEGGIGKIVWEGGDGSQMEMRFKFLEVKPPERVVHTESWGPDFDESAVAVETWEFVDTGRGSTLLRQTLKFQPGTRPMGEMLDGTCEGTALGYAHLEDLLMQGAL